VFTPQMLFGATQSTRRRSNSVSPLFFLLLVLLVQSVQSCIPREEVINRMFSEVQSLGYDHVTLEMMSKFESHLPPVQRWLVRRVVPHSVEWMFHRCAGEDGKITLESSLARPKTCISTCLIARATTKFLDWGYAKYWVE